MPSKNHKTVIVWCLIVTFGLLTACAGSSNVDSVSISSVVSASYDTREYIIRFFRPYEFSTPDEIIYSGLPLVTATSPDGRADLQMLGPEEDIQSARVLIYLPLDAANNYAEHQREYLEILLTSVFLYSWPDMEEWLDNAIDRASGRSDGALEDGVKIATRRTTPAGEIAVTLYVRYLEDDQGFVMGVIIGDWLEDIKYDPVLNTWQP